MMGKEVCECDRERQKDVYGLDKRVNCKECVKCGSKKIDVAYMERYHDEEKGWIEECLLKTCQCGYAWIEDCNDKKKGGKK